MNNRFTVIMPTYNQAGFIRRAIQSLLNQTLQEWELIIINDGSTDATCSYVTPFLTDKRFTYVENKQQKKIEKFYMGQKPQYYGSCQHVAGCAELQCTCVR